MALHLVFLGLLLMQGCKKDETTAAPGPAELPPLTNDLADAGMSSSNLPPLGGALGTAGQPYDAGAATLPPLGGTGQVSGGGAPPLSGMDQPVIPPVVDQPVVTPGTVEYTVARNDSFYSIGRKFKVSPTAIAKANPGVDSTKLKIGQKLQIPSSSSSAASASAPATVGMGGDAGELYTVKSGDTLSKIARMHGTTYTQIMQLNGMTSTRINPGQKLKMPARPVAPAPAAEPVSAPSFNPAPVGAAPASGGGALPQ